MSIKVALAVLVGAATAGAGAGAVLHWLDAPTAPPALADMKTRTIVPYVVEDEADVEWRSRSDDSADAEASGEGASAAGQAPVEDQVPLQISTVD